MLGCLGNIAMTDWSSGYVVDLPYTAGFYSDMTPNHLGLIALINGLAGPGLDLKPLNYCELGCGQGVSMNVFAASNPHIQFYANDFNPSHIAAARSLAAGGKLSNVHFSDDSFAEYLARDDLPEFDIIALHGIYSWVSAENRQLIVQFIKKKLKVGGLVYISYNALPGWAQIMPLRKLMIEYAALQGQSRPLQPRIASAIEFARKLKSLEGGYLGSSPRAAARVDELKSQPSNYIAHEYFNRDLTPFFFMDVAQDMADAKLSYVGSSQTLETIDTIQLTEDQRKFLAEIDSEPLRQTVRDHFLDQMFRRDVFIKGQAGIPEVEIKERWLNTRFMLTRKAADVPRSMKGLRFTANFNSDLYEPLIKALEQGPKSMRELQEADGLGRNKLSALIEAVTYLNALGACRPCLPEEGEAQRKVVAAQFNEAVATKTSNGKRLSHFASPVLGNGVPLDSSDQMIWLAMRNGAHDVPRYIWDSLLSKMGVRLMKDDKPLHSEEDNINELRSRTSEAPEKLFPFWRSLGIMPDVT